MTHAQQVEVADQVGLVDPHFGGCVAAIALRACGAVTARGDAGGVDVGSGHRGIAGDVAVAREVLQAQVIVEVVLEVGGE
ncbi:hypothetical protein D3C85_1490430 [compost metagenome]